MLSTIAEAVQNMCTEVNIVAVVIGVVTERKMVLIRDESVDKPSHVAVPSCINLLHSVRVGDVLQFTSLEVTARNIDERTLDLRSPALCGPACAPVPWKKLRHRDLATCLPSGRAALVARLSNEIRQSILPKLPCRRRRLDQIQSAGLLSHVVVRICRVDTHTNPPSTRKRKRGVTNVSFAALSDDGREDLLLVDCQHWLRELRARLGQWVEIHNVLSKHGCVQGREDLVLVPTPATRIAEASSPVRSTSPEVEETPLPCQTALTAGLKAIRIGNRWFTKNRAALERSILVGGEEVHPCYRNANLVLRNSDGDLSCSADAGVVETLCAGVKAGHLMCNTELAEAVEAFLSALLQENVQLKWWLVSLGQVRQVKGVRILSITS